MLKNNIKDDIKNALERTDFATNGSNIEMVYQIYVGSTEKKSIGVLIVELSGVLKK